jgi:hypothetical protein
MPANFTVCHPPFLYSKGIYLFFSLSAWPSTLSFPRESLSSAEDSRTFKRDNVCSSFRLSLIAISPYLYQMAGISIGPPSGAESNAVRSPCLPFYLLLRWLKKCWFGWSSSALPLLLTISILWRVGFRRMKDRVSVTPVQREPCAWSANTKTYSIHLYI